MTTVMNRQGEVVVDASAGEAATSEELLARVLDDATVASQAAQVRGQGVRLVGRGGSAAAADQAVPGGHIGG